jgi:hypothetical protein
MLNYSELDYLLRNELERVRNVRKFCNEHWITQSLFIKISQIVNKNSDKKYTELEERNNMKKAARTSQVYLIGLAWY